MKENGQVYYRNLNHTDIKCSPSNYQDNNSNWDVSLILHNAVHTTGPAEQGWHTDDGVIEITEMFIMHWIEKEAQLIILVE